ncbi:hypothetical protein Airi01_093240 [Actinoallomurus iriomotensis]|uniref:Uncharacterized protein n=1 Tax=Actinoallomurus iriomotensis TaxID=478107 RepID=A0A9W6RVT2_9ACTN|nr:hypothetical protein Airi01_093240 [Actinoallomurus iriomotensis]
MGRVAERHPVQKVSESPRWQEPQDESGEPTGRPVEDMSVLEILGDLEWAGDGQGPGDPTHPLTVHRTSSDGSGSDTSLPRHLGTMRGHVQPVSLLRAAHRCE